MSEPACADWVRQIDVLKHIVRVLNNTQPDAVTWEVVNGRAFIVSRRDRMDKLEVVVQEDNPLTASMFAVCFCETHAQQLEPLLRKVAEL